MFFGTKDIFLTAIFHTDNEKIKVENNNLKSCIHLFFVITMAVKFSGASISLDFVVNAI